MNLRGFFQLQKNEVKRLKSLSRAQNRTPARNVKPPDLGGPPTALLRAPYQMSS